MKYHVTLRPDHRRATRRQYFRIPLIYHYTSLRTQFYCIIHIFISTYISKTPRYTIREQILDDGMVSELGISHTYRQDTGMYICQAGNAFGQVTLFFYLKTPILLINFLS